MYGYVYITTNLINNKRYIGQHRSDKFDTKYKGSGTLITQAFKKYGFENFRTTILEWFDSPEELNEGEKRYIKEYEADTSDSFYNITRGGDGHSCEPWNKGLKKAQPLTDKMIDSLDKGRHLPASEKLKQKLRNRKDLVEYTDEYRNKLSQAQKHNRTVNDGVKNYIIKDYELDEYLNKGFIRGRIKSKKFND